jgi:hypothetical protein
MRLPAHQIGDDDAEPGDLGDRQVDEDDAALEHELPERNMGGEDEDAGQEGRHQDFEAMIGHRHVPPARQAGD